MNSQKHVKHSYRNWHESELKYYWDLEMVLRKIDQPFSTLPY